MMSSLPLLQLARVKGLLSADAAATVLCLGGNDVAQEFERFRAKGWLDATSRGWRLSPAGRKAVAALLEEERSALDGSVLTGLYAEFCVINRELKATMTAYRGSCIIGAA
jgi:hypothetical protein